MKRARTTLLVAVLAVFLCASAQAGLWPRGLRAYLGTAPTLDGVISAGEYDDATRFRGVRGWSHTFTPTRDDSDLSFVGYVKHDAKRLYFAFEVTDDILYGIDTPRWEPQVNPHVHELSRRGYPWFGDEIEILINADNHFPRGVHAEGTARSWQMVCNLTKSRLGGVGHGGLLEGEPRSRLPAWEQYQEWIMTGAMQACAKPKPEGKGYVIEWAISFDPCLEVDSGRCYSTDMGDVKMGLNIAIGDIDTPEKGEGNFANFHHEEWFAGRKSTRTLRREWGSLWMMAGPRPQRARG